MKALMNKMSVKGKRRLILFLLTMAVLVLLGGAWSIYRNQKYPIFEESRIMNKFIVPKWLFSPKNASTLNSLSSKGGLPEVIEGVDRTTATFKSRDNTELPITIYSPTGTKDKKLPAIIYIHGGGFMLRDFAGQHQMSAEYAKRTNARVFFVNYRTADNYPFPTPFYDSTDTLQYVWNNREKFNIDEKKIALAGDSAGGALAASTQLWARNETDIQISFLLLIYPVTDSRMKTQSMKKFTDSPIWNAKLTQKMWELYLRNGNNERPEYSSPALARDFEKLSNAYIEVAEFDALRDEGLAYAETLKNAGNQVEVNYVKGGFHAYDTDLYNNPHTQKALEQRVAALKQAFK